MMTAANTSTAAAATPAVAASSPLLEVDGLATHFATRAGVVRAVDGVSFTVARGEIVGLVGESGSGKSMTGYSIMGLVDAPGRIVAGGIGFDGVEITALSPREMRRLRGDRIAMIFQDPMMTLNPVLSIRTQMVEAIRAHRSVSRADAQQEARDALAKVGIAAPDARLAAYPHQLSGGTRQRVAIAIALLNDAELIIADEPTTALDVTIQGQILHEMQKQVRDAGTALLWITHDLSVVAGLADRVCVMYAGRIVEQGAVDDVLVRPRHPYTQGLIDSVPARALRGARLRQIPGMPPSALNPPRGCAFRERCGFASAACGTMPELRAIGLPGRAHAVRCHHPLGGEDA